MNIDKKRKRTVALKVENSSNAYKDLFSSSEDEYIPDVKKKKTEKENSEDEYIPDAKKKKTEAKKRPVKIKKEKAEPKTKKRASTAKNTKKVESTLNITTSHVKKEVAAVNNNQLETKPTLSSNIFHFEPTASLNTSNIQWTDEEVVAESCDVSLYVAKNVVSLLKQDCTVPFIVRYRSEQTGGLQAEKIREIQEALDEVKLVHKKVDNILKTTKHEKFDESVQQSFLCAKSLDEVELLYAPFKPGSKRTLAERSKQLGLEPLSLQVMNGQTSLHGTQLMSMVKIQEGLESEKDVVTGIQNIIADKLSKDSKVLDFIREKIRHPRIRMLCSKSAGAEKLDRQAFCEGKTTQNFKFENYYQFNTLVSNIQDHQIMAINRGEKLKVLKVKVELPEALKSEITRFVETTFLCHKYSPDTRKFLQTCTADAYDRFIEPYMCRRIRSELSKKAEKESIRVFGSNVHNLLLTPPVRGKTVIGIDPGFSHGCKVACVSPKGEVFATDVIYPHQKNKNRDYGQNAKKIHYMVSSYGAEVFAIGNGTACRETEVWLSDLIKSMYFKPFVVKYCIVNENGASIYSVTKEAEADLPGMEPNLRSAVSIARRLQDPLLEYVKIEPKHLGVGSYQHDVSESQLKKTLDSIVEECVSFVGVDLNVCSEMLLRKISGLSSVRAKAIVDWRLKNGSFTNRSQLLKVKGLGNKTFEQCAGFVKILPLTANTLLGKMAEPFEPLDRTIIHPESYALAKKFLNALRASSDEIGQQSLKTKVSQYMNLQKIEDIAGKFNVQPSAIKLVVDAFQQLEDYDYRAEFDQPLFRTSVSSLSDLKPNQQLTGRVQNVTGFGAFVDIGVGTDGLVHTSKMRGKQLSVNDRVTVKVLQVDVGKKRIGLEVVLT